MPRQPEEPGKSALAPKGVGVADAFARFSDTMSRAANRGNPASAAKRMADQRVQEAMSAFGATIGQTVDNPSATRAGKTIDPDRAGQAGLRLVGVACAARCAEAG